MSRPTDFCGGKAFRDAEVSDWSPQPDDDAIDLARAWKHYGLARGVLRALETSGFTLRDLADAAGTSYEDQRRKISGDRFPNDRDIALWSIVASGQAEVLGDFDGLFPPGTVNLTGRWVPGQWIPTLQSKPDSDIDTDALSRHLIEAVDEALQHDLNACLDDGAVRFMTARSLQRTIGNGANINPDAGFLTVGTPDHAVFGCISTMSANRHEARRSMGKAIEDVSQRLGQTRIVVWVGDDRTRAAIDGLVPDGSTTTMGPLSDLGEWWQQHSVDLTILGQHSWKHQCRILILAAGKAVPI